MRPARRFTYLLLLNALLAGVGCDRESKKQEAEVVAPPVAKAPAPAAGAARAPSEWFEGAFEGKAELPSVSTELEGDAEAKSREAASNRAAEPLSLLIEVVSGKDGVTGSGTARKEGLVVSGIADASAARLTIAGETVRGTFVGHADEKAKSFKGTARLSRTETHEGKVSAEVFAGELVLTKRVENSAK